MFAIERMVELVCLLGVGCMGGPMTDGRTETPWGEPEIVDLTLRYRGTFESQIRRSGRMYCYWGRPLGWDG